MDQPTVSIHISVYKLQVSILMNSPNKNKASLFFLIDNGMNSQDRMLISSSTGQKNLKTANKKESFFLISYQHFRLLEKKNEATMYYLCTVTLHMVIDNNWHSTKWNLNSREAWGSYILMTTVTPLFRRLVISTLLASYQFGIGVCLKAAHPSRIILTHF